MTETLTVDSSVDVGEGTQSQAATLEASKNPVVEATQKQLAAELKRKQKQEKGFHMLRKLSKATAIVGVLGPLGPLGFITNRLAAHRERTARNAQSDILRKSTRIQRTEARAQSGKR